MKQTTSNNWMLDSIDELRSRCKSSDKGKHKYRFHCPLCGDESKHSKRTDGAFDEDKGVGHCFCCGANFFASKWKYKPDNKPMAQKPEISLGSYPSSIMTYLKARGLKAETMPARTGWGPSTWSQTNPWPGWRRAYPSSGSGSRCWSVSWSRA